MQKWLGGGSPEEGESDEGRLAEWVSPEAGMFFWQVFCFASLGSLLIFFSIPLYTDRFKLLVEPASAQSFLPDSEEQDSRTLIETHAFANGVLALPGTVFLPNGSKTPYVRASFSLLGEEQVVEAMKRLRKTVLEVRRERSSNTK